MVVCFGLCDLTCTVEFRGNERTVLKFLGYALRNTREIAWDAVGDNVMEMQHHESVSG